METATPPSTHPVYSNVTVFRLIEDYFLGIQSKNIDRVTEVFHPDVEYRGEPIKPVMGMRDFKFTILQLLEKTHGFYFKIKSVLWDKELSQGSAVIEYEHVTTDGKGSRVFEIAVFKMVNNMITYYIGSKTVISTWQS